MAQIEQPLESPVAPRRRFSWRRLVTFRLRTLLLLVTIIALALGWWVGAARRRHAAVAALLRSGAEVQEYDFEADGLKSPPYWPE